MIIHTNWGALANLFNFMWTESPKVKIDFISVHSTTPGIVADTPLQFYSAKAQMMAGLRPVFDAK